MGRIVCQLEVANAIDKTKRLELSALVDTGAAFLTLPLAWKDRLGDLETVREVQLETATQATIQGEICAPVWIKLEGFEPVVGEVLFIEMTPEDGNYEPLVGYVVLESSQAGVDMLGHRLIKIKHADLK